MLNNKIFILLPDGIGLRNFAYSSFYEIGKKQGFDVIFWNNTPFPLIDLGFQEIKIENAKTHVITEIYKNVKIQIELNLNVKKTNNKVYNTYRFPFSYKNINNVIKNIVIKFLSLTHSSENGIEIIRNRIREEERKTLHYNRSKETLKKHKPAFVFCTNQRISLAIAPLLAAQDLNIPTATFIFSWDNLPKGTMIVETDYYFVWSLHMKKELLYYYPYVDDDQVIVTGTPQFENHFKLEDLIDKELFFKQNGLDIEKKYICYSGDDQTTSPYDPNYLLDLIKAVRNLNESGSQLGIIFRRCPVDFSDRFDEILKENKDIVIAIVPKWDKVGEGWNTILPTPEDSILQMNIVAHTELVVNLGSSMVFDYAAQTKPCAFMNYNPKLQNKSWSVGKIYDFVHFRSMPTDAVVWLNSPEEIAAKIKLMLSDDAQKIVANAEEWFEKINQHPADQASQRIWDAIAEICKK
jgi:hypothetical protein